MVRPRSAGALSSTGMASLREAWRLGGIRKSFSFTGNSWLSMPGDINVSKIGDGSDNSAVEACLKTLVKAVAEPPIGVSSDDGIDVFHPAAQLLARPSKWMRGTLLTRHVVSSITVRGYSTVYKLRSPAGRVAGLIPLANCLPADGGSQLATGEERQAKADGGGEIITHFEHQTVRGLRRIEVDDIIYLREDVDPDDLKMGRSSMRTLLREVLQDEEASLFAAALLSNMGVPGYVLIPELQPGETGPSEKESDAIAEAWHRKLTGARRGRPIMLPSGVVPHRLSFTPEELNFEAVRRIPEERIAAAIGVPAIIAGLGAGLERGTYSNARELREFFTEQTVSTWWSLLAEEYTYQLLPDFGGGIFEYDLSNVRAFQEDQDALWTRWLAALNAGTVTVAEFREAVGLDELENTDVFLRPLNTVELPITGPDPTAELEAVLNG